MSAANIYAGVAMDFGAGDVGVTGTGVGTFTIQSWDYANKADKDEVRDANGNMATVTFYNPSAEASFDYIPSHATSIASAQAAVTIPQIGTKCTVTSSLHTAIAGTNWRVMDAQIKATNTKNKVISLKLVQWPNITIDAGA